MHARHAFYELSYILGPSQFHSYPTEVLWSFGVGPLEGRRLRPRSTYRQEVIWSGFTEAFAREAQGFHPALAGPQIPFSRCLGEAPTTYLALFVAALWSCMSSLGVSTFVLKI